MPMKISEIKIHGIKSFRESTIGMSDYTVFVGENNSGENINNFFGGVR